MCQVWGEIGRTLATLAKCCLRWTGPTRGRRRRSLDRWRTEKARRRTLADERGRMHPALLFGVLGDVAPEDAVIPVDVGNNTYAFGHYFECKSRQDVLMSGYLGSIGFSLPAALGAWAAVQGERKGAVYLR